MMMMMMTMMMICLYCKRIYCV